MSRIWLLSLLVTTAVVIVLSDGAPMHPKFELRKLLRTKRGIFGQISSTVPSTNAPRVFIGNTRPSRRKSTTTTTTTLKTIISDSDKSTSTTSPISDLPSTIELENLQSAKPIIDDDDKTMEDDIVTFTKSTTTLSPVYLHDQPSAQRLHQKEATIPTTMSTPAPAPVSSTTTEEVPQVSQNEVSSTTAVETSSRKFEDDARDKAGVANNRALSSTSIWNLIVVLLQLTYSLIPQKIPP